MKNIVWIQTDNCGDGDSYFVDGKLINEQSSLLLETVNKVIKVQGSKECLSKENLTNRQITSCPNFTLVNSIFNGFLYKSEFNEISKSGRQRGFLFWSRIPDIDNMWETIQACAAPLGYTVKETDIKIVEEYIHKSIRRNTISFFISVLILVIIILLIVWTL